MILHRCGSPSSPAATQASKTSSICDSSVSPLAVEVVPRDELRDRVPDRVFPFVTIVCSQSEARPSKEEHRRYANPPSGERTTREPYRERSSMQGLSGLSHPHFACELMSSSGRLIRYQN